MWSFRVLNLVVYIITGVLYTGEFGEERDAMYQTAVTVTVSSFGAGIIFVILAHPVYKM